MDESAPPIVPLEAIRQTANVRKHGKMNGIYRVFVAIRKDDPEENLQWAYIDTGLSGLIDEEGDFVIPYSDKATAEEVGRVITGSIRRELGSRE